MFIEHIAIYLDDLEAGKAFFEKYFNGTAGERYHNPNTGFSSYFITFEDGARLELMHKPDMRDQIKYLSRTGYAHMTFSVGSKEKVDELTQILKEDGYCLISGPRITGDGYYESCILGFENNQIEITI